MLAMAVGAAVHLAMAVAAHGLAAAARRDEGLVAGHGLRVEGAGQRGVVLLGVVDATAGVGRGWRAATRGTRRTVGKEKY